MENMKTLLIYDNTGVIISQSMGNVREPVGLPFLWVDKVADGKCIVSVDTSVTPNVAVFDDIVKTQGQILQIQVEELIEKEEMTEQQITEAQVALCEIYELIAEMGV